jgi:Protein of Unknown function (DUF2784)
VLYRLGADVVLLAHFMFAAFAVFGGFLALWSPAWPWLHIPTVLWSSVVNLMSWTCPLTPLENALRTRAGQTKYSGSFVQRYIGPMVYPRGMPRELELVAAASVVGWNVLVYAAMFWLVRRPAV